MGLILLIVIVILIFGGIGWGNGRWYNVPPGTPVAPGQPAPAPGPYWDGPYIGGGLVGLILVVLLVLFLMGRI